MTRASRRIGSATGAHPHWRDGALLDRSVDRLGLVTLAPGTAERIAVESRRAIASAAIGVPTALILVMLALVAGPLVVLEGEARLPMLVMPFYILTSLATLFSQTLAAGRMALLRDAADAELALPESERPQAPFVEPPHGSMLP